MLEVVAALIERDGRFLVCQRAPGKSQAGLWEFPGGKVEPGETHRQALARELAEELAISARADSLFAENEYAYPDLTIQLSVWRTQILSGEPRALEHSQIRFVSKEDMADLAFCPADLPAVRALLGED